MIRSRHIPLSVSLSVMMLCSACFEDGVRLYVKVDDSCSTCCADQLFDVYVGGYKEGAIRAGKQIRIERETGTGNEVLEVQIVDGEQTLTSTVQTCQACIQSEISDDDYTPDANEVYALYDDDISFVDADLHATIRCEPPKGVSGFLDGDADGDSDGDADGDSDGDTDMDSDICADTPGFVDEDGYSCSDWSRYDCTEAVSRWGYSQAGEDALLENCPATCGLCS